MTSNFRTNPTVGSIHQIVAGFRQYDAISNEALCLQRVFRGWGFASEIGCELRQTDPQDRPTVREAAELARDLGPDDVALLHLSTGSALNALFASLRCRKVILYHNITPAAFFGRLNPVLSAELEEGRRQVAALAGVADLNLADSRFNAEELIAMGYDRVKVLPLIMDFSRLLGEIDNAMREQFTDGALNLLFVGRCVPNKRIESLLRVLHLLQRTDARRIRLLLVGSHAGAEIYRSTLLAQVRALALREVHFLGTLQQAQLNACYAAADVFLCLSEHEGFCVPLLEAMAHDLPIVALKRAAVPETLGSAGIQLDQLDFELIAEVVRLLVDDAALRRGVIEGQRSRLRAYRSRDPSGELRALLAPLLNAGQGAERRLAETV